MEPEENMNQWRLLVTDITDVKDYLIAKYGSLHMWLTTPGLHSFWLYSQEIRGINAPSYASFSPMLEGERYRVITLGEFKRLTSNKKVGKVEYVRCMAYGVKWGNDTGLSLTEGKIYPFHMIIDNEGRSRDLNPNIDMWKKEFTVATKEDYDRQNTPKPVNKEERLKEAARRYPVGTQFKSPQDNKVYTVIAPHPDFSDTNTHWGRDGILARTTRNSGEWVYWHGEWAEIISQPAKESAPEKANLEFQVGDVVVIINQYMSTTHNGKLGTIEEIDNSMIPYRVSIVLNDDVCWCISVRRATFSERQGFTTPPEQKKEEEAEVGSFKVGDWIKYNGTQLRDSLTRTLVRQSLEDSFYRKRSSLSRRI